MLSAEREKLYTNLGLKTGDTLLVQYVGNVSNNNKIWIKRECDNPFGSHYDRVYVNLFRHYEEINKIQPGNKVLETTSGTAGASFAGIGKELGFGCHVAIPEGVDEAIIKAIRSYNATIHFTNEKDYIAGFPEWLRDFLPRHNDFTFLNHSMGPRKGVQYSNNEITLGALEDIAKEVLEAISVDFYVVATGNGSSILGPGRIFHPNSKIIAFESAQSGVIFEEMYPGEYEKRFGIKIGTLPRHKLRGTSYPGVNFPHIKTVVREGIVDDVMLVSDQDVDRNYFELVGRRDFEGFPHWDDPAFQYQDLGRSGRAGIGVALKVADKVSDKNIMIIAYDKADRYDS